MDQRGLVAVLVGGGEPRRATDPRRVVCDGTRLPCVTERRMARGRLVVGDGAGRGRIPERRGRGGSRVGLHDDRVLVALPGERCVGGCFAASRQDERPRGRVAHPRQGGVVSSGERVLHGGLEEGAEPGAREGGHGARREHRCAEPHLYAPLERNPAFHR